MILYHYTDEQGLQGILATGTLLASTTARNLRDARYGNGQSLIDLEPGSKTPAQLSREFPTCRILAAISRTTWRSPLTV
jgi:hypothetical protein